jgi:hypothetical protein
MLRTRIVSPSFSTRVVFIQRRLRLVPVPNATDDCRTVRPIRREPGQEESVTGADVADVASTTTSYAEYGFCSMRKTCFVLHRSRKRGQVEDFRSSRG